MEQANEISKSQANTSPTGDTTMLIEWDATLSVGNDKIDKDHEALVGIVNKLDDAISHAHGNNIIADILSELSDYIGYHFENEEQIMRRHHYPAFDEHVQEHSDLIKGLDTLVYEFEASPTTVTEDTLEFLKHWLIDHVRGCDMKLGHYLQGNIHRA